MRGKKELYKGNEKCLITFCRNKMKKRNRQEVDSPQFLAGDKLQLSTLKPTPRPQVRKRGQKEKEDAEREMEMEKFRSHYRVTARNIKRRREGERLLGPGGGWKPSELREEERRKADIEELVLQDRMEHSHRPRLSKHCALIG